MPLSLAEELEEVIAQQISDDQNFNQSEDDKFATSAGDLSDSDVESLVVVEPRYDAKLVDDDATIAILQHARIVQSERANITVREALNNSGATLSVCAQVLSAMIQSPHIKPEIRRRAVIDVLTLHNANPLPIKQTPDQPNLQISIQTSDKVNLATILNPNGKR